ncbi:MAG: iron-containing alcohol dehydrogenase [Leptospirales bacterium]|nr:iron-containing alcohol dehydrogenase [Leptospirales bacterium]
MQFPLDRVVQYNFPTRIRAGLGARKEIGTYLKGEGVKRPLIVTDRELAKLPIPAEIEKIIGEAGLACAIFSGVGGNPVESHVKAGVEAFHAHKADAIVALGGGAAMDVGKAMLIMAHHPGNLFDYEDGKPDGRPVDGTVPHFITIPTTAGTGTEVGRSTVISDDATHAKKIMFSPRLLAKSVFADPELTLGLPAKVTAATGMDALTHLVETYLANDFHPMCDGIALEGIRLISKSLADCVRFAKMGTPGNPDQSPEHKRARGLMLNAALMGGVAFQKGLGAVHSCAHPLSTVFDFHHGLANGIMLPYVMEFNAVAVPERFIALAEAVGLKDKTATAFVKWIQDLNQEIGIPRTIAEAGAKEDKIDELVKFAVADVCHAMNPRPVTAADFKTLYSKAFKG